MGRRFGFGGPGPRMFERGGLKYALLELLQERPKHGYEMMKELEERMGGFYAPSAGAIYPTLQLLEDRGWVSVETVEGKKIYTITDAGRQAVQENAQRAEARANAPHEHGHHEHEHGHHEHGPHSGPESGPGGPGGPWAWGERGPRGGRRGGFGPGFGPGGPGGPGFGPGAFGPGAWRGQPEAQALAREVRDVGRLMLMAGMQSIGQPERLSQLKGIVERARGEIEAFLNQAHSQPNQSGPSTVSDAPQGDESGPVESV
jgi:DNA-binding PadR family transcriptional regulator